MTCAPRGIFNTKSESRGRKAMKRDPRLDRNTVPSGVPAMSACAMTPVCEWNSPCSVRVMR